MANQVDNVVYFPQTLEPNRNVWFNFYASDIDTIKVPVDTILTQLKGEVQTRVSNKKLDTSDVLEKGKEAENSKTWKASIALPIPNNLQESLNHEWNEESGIVGYYLDKGLNSFDVVSRVVQGVSTLSGTRNITTNPDYVQIYKGSKPRSITFTWQFLPNSRIEAETLWTIIRRFKTYSSPHPSKTNAFLTAPYFCEIIFENERMETSLKLNEMIINEISVNYSESGYMEMFYDGTPKTLSLTIRFTERKPKMFEDWMTDEEKSTYENKQSDEINKNETGSPA